MRVLRKEWEGQNHIIAAGPALGLRPPAECRRPPQPSTTKRAKQRPVPLGPGRCLGKVKGNGEIRSGVF